MTTSCILRKVAGLPPNDPAGWLGTELQNDSSSYIPLDFFHGMTQHFAPVALWLAHKSQQLNQDVLLNSAEH